MQQVITRTDPLGSQKISVLDAMGRVVSYKEGKDMVWVERYYTYDGLGRLITTGEKHQSGIVNTTFSYTYDTNNKTMKVEVGAPGNDQAITSLEYNGNGQLLNETDPLGKVTRNKWSPWGRLASYTNGRNQKLTYGYDAAGRFDRITLPGAQGDIAHTLDGIGNRTETKVNGQSTIVRTFDNWNRLSSRGNDHQESIRYQYTAVDQVQQLTYSDGKTVQYEYDNLYRMTRVTDWANRVTDYSYSPPGMVKEIDYPNASKATFAFDDANRLTNLQHQSGDLIVAKLDFTLDALGNPAVNNAIFPLPPDLTTGSHAFAYNEANQLTQYNGANLTYDSDGNQKTVPVNGGTKTASYDIFNRLTGVGSDTYGYDADGLRTDSALSGTKQFYINDIGGYESRGWNAPIPSAALLAGLRKRSTRAALAIPRYWGMRKQSCRLPVH